MYGNQKAWTRLTQTAKKGATSITLSGDVSAWPVGGTVALASTDYDYRQSETRLITKVKKGNFIESTVNLEKGHQFFSPHFQVMVLPL